MGKAKRQGDLDGLCGMYAIVNAFQKLNIRQEANIFETCCEALSASRWPHTLWEGTTLRDIETMVKACREGIHGIDTIKVSYPFRAKQPTSNDEFWTRFDELFHLNRKNKCAIIGLTEPAMHWLVAAPKKEVIAFTDSNALKEVRVPRAKIYAGQRRPNGETHRIVRKEVILFERQS